MGLIEELKAKNFTIYAQWAGLISIVLLIICGIAHFALASILAWILAFILVFVEVPLCMRICPTSNKFDKFIKIFENNYFRTIGYLLFSTVILIIGILEDYWVYVLAGIVLAFTGIFYGIAAIKRQDHKSSSITGGSGVDNV